jgi:hypothetical protein
MISALRHIPWSQLDPLRHEPLDQAARGQDAEGRGVPLAGHAPSTRPLLDLLGGRNTDELLLDMLRPPSFDTVPLKGQQWFRVLREVRAAIERELQSDAAGTRVLRDAAAILDEVGLLNDLALDYILAVQPG